MTIEMIDYDNYTLQLCQGDSGYMGFRYPYELAQGKTVYFAFRDEKRKLIGEELTATFTQSTAHPETAIASIFIPSSLTDLLVVDEEENSKVYFWSMKMCSTDSNNNQREDTAKFGDSRFGQVIVLPKWVEGTTGATT